MNAKDQAVFWDPCYNPRVLDASRLVPFVGGLGTGKSWLARRNRSAEEGKP